MGSFAVFGSAGSNAAHGCALAVQMSAMGAKSLGSSRLVALMTMARASLTELLAKSGAPHSGQNARCAVLPLSARTSCHFGVP